MKHPINRRFRDVVNIMLRRTITAEPCGGSINPPLPGSRRLCVVRAADVVQRLFVYDRYTKKSRRHWQT